MKTTNPPKNRNDVSKQYKYARVQLILFEKVHPALYKCTQLMQYAIHPYIMEEFLTNSRKLPKSSIS